MNVEMRVGMLRIEARIPNRRPLHRCARVSSRPTGTDAASLDSTEHYSTMPVQEEECDGGLPEQPPAGVVAMRGASLGWLVVAGERVPCPSSPGVLLYTMPHHGRWLGHLWAGTGGLAVV